MVIVYVGKNLLILTSFSTSPTKLDAEDDPAF